MDGWYFAIFVVLVVGYLFTFWKRFPLHRQNQVFSKNRVYYRNWVRHVLNDVSAGVYAVQTLRNSMMAANILSSTAILLIMGTINLGFSSSGLDWFNRLLEKSRSVPQWQHFKLYLLLGLFASAFFLFVISIRFYTHLGYMAAPPAESSTADDLKRRREDAEDYLLRGATCFALGIRMFFFAIPPMFWLGGGVPFMVCTVLMLSALLVTDHL